MLRLTLRCLGKDAYRILGVDKSAGDAEIKKAYKKKAAQLHPDVSNRPNASEEFAELQGAYETLKDPRKRQFYNSTGSNPSSEQDLRGFEDFQKMQRAQQEAAQQRAKQQQQQHHRQYTDFDDPYGFYQGGGGGGGGRAGHFRRWEQNPWEEMGGAFYQSAGPGPEWGDEEFGGAHMGGMRMGMGMHGDGPFEYTADYDDIPPWMGGPMHGRYDSRKPPKQQKSKQQGGQASGAKGGASSNASGGNKKSEKEVDLVANAVLEITFDEMLKGGGAKTLSFDARKTCWTCEGAGTPGKTKPKYKSCGTCAGRGYVIVQMTPAEVAGLECEDCGGSGSITMAPPDCSRCSGTGVVAATTAVTLGVPAGLESGSVIRVVGEGHVSKSDKAKRGDLLLHVHVQGQSKQYTRDKDGALHTTIPVPMATALLGGTVTINDLHDQPVDVEIPANTLPLTEILLPFPGLHRYAPGTELKMKLNEMPEAPGSKPGKVFGHVVVTYPTPGSLTDAQIDALKSIEALSASHPQSRYTATGVMDYVRAKHRAPDSNKRPRIEQPKEQQQQQQQQSKDHKDGHTNSNRKDGGKDKRHGGQKRGGHGGGGGGRYRGGGGGGRRNYGHGQHFSDYSYF